MQVSQNGLDIIGFIIDRLASEFKPYLNTVLGSVQDRLGDTRPEVREKANIVLCKLMDATIAPQPLFEKIQPAFSHKNSRVREEVLLLLQNTLNAHGAGQLTVSKLIPSIVTAYSDPQAAVRDAALQTLVEIYRLDWLPRYDSAVLSSRYLLMIALRYLSVPGAWLGVTK